MFYELYINTTGHFRNICLINIAFCLSLFYIWITLENNKNKHYVYNRV